MACHFIGNYSMTLIIVTGIENNISLSKGQKDIMTMKTVVEVVVMFV